MKDKSKVISFDYPVYDTIDDCLSDITAIYLRVSTDMQAQDGYGLDVQYSAIRKYCQAFDLSNPVIFVDDGYTGVNTDRPAYQNMLTLMKQKRIKFVITYSLDRIGRTQMLILKFLKENCEEANCDFLAVKDNVDSRSKQTYGILISILSIFAEFDHDAIVAKLTQGRIQRALSGYWKGGGNPPYGYRYSKEINNLEVVPEEALNVKKVFEMYVSMEYSPRMIAEALGLSGDTLVFHILKNRTYLGEITFRGVQYQGSHQRLIENELFNQAQDILEKKSVKRSASNYLLSSLLYCGHCHNKMRYQRWRDKTGKKTHLKIMCYSKYDYHKKSVHTDPNCPNLIYEAEVIEKSVIDVVMKFAVQYSEELASKSISESDIITGLEKEVERLETEYKRLLTAYRKIGDEGILEDAADIEKSIKRITREIESEREKETIARSLEDKVDILRTLPDTWDQMTARQKQSLIRELVQKVTVTSGDIVVYLMRDKYDKLLLDGIDNLIEDEDSANTGK